MSKTRIVLNHAGIARFLRDQKHNPKMIAALEEEAEKLAKRAGPGFEVAVSQNRRNRPGVIVYPSTAHARRAQAKDNRLGRALGGD